MALAIQLTDVLGGSYYLFLKYFFLIDFKGFWK